MHDCAGKGGLDQRCGPGDRAAQQEVGGGRGGALAFLFPCDVLSHTPLPTKTACVLSYSMLDRDQVDYDYNTAR